VHTLDPTVGPVRTLLLTRFDRLWTRVLLLVQLLRYTASGGVVCFVLLGRIEYEMQTKKKEKKRLFSPGRLRFCRTLHWATPAEGLSLPSPTCRIRFCVNARQLSWAPTMKYKVSSRSHSRRTGSPRFSLRKRSRRAHYITHTCFTMCLKHHLHLAVLSRARAAGRRLSTLVHAWTAYASARTYRRMRVRAFDESVLTAELATYVTHDIVHRQNVTHTSTSFSLRTTHWGSRFRAQ
jgi:hypothetical protein